MTDKRVSGVIALLVLATLARAEPATPDPGKPSEDHAVQTAATRVTGIDVQAWGGTSFRWAEESEFGKFGWVIDPEGNKVELWQPPEGK